MTARTTVSHRPDGIAFRRRLRQSPSAVFAAFADPALLVRWWGPPECPVVESSMDFRPGGVWLYRVRSVPSGEEAWTRSVFLEIEPERRIVFRETSSNPAGTITGDRPPAHTVVELVPDGGGTLLAIDVRHVSEREADRARERGVERGFSHALDQLDELLSSIPGVEERTP